MYIRTSLFTVLSFFELDSISTFVLPLLLRGPRLRFSPNTDLGINLLIYSEKMFLRFWTLSSSVRQTSVCVISRLINIGMISEWWIAEFVCLIRVISCSFICFFTLLACDLLNVGGKFAMKKKGIIVKSIRFCTWFKHTKQFANHCQNFIYKIRPLLCNVTKYGNAWYKVDTLNSKTESKWCKSMWLIEKNGNLDIWGVRAYSKSFSIRNFPSWIIKFLRKYLLSSSIWSRLKPSVSNVFASYVFDLIKKR